MIRCIFDCRCMSHINCTFYRRAFVGGLFMFTLMNHNNVSYHMAYSDYMFSRRLSQDLTDITETFDIADEALFCKILITQTTY